MMKPAPTLHTLLRATAVAALLLVTLGCSLHRARKAFDEGRYNGMSTADAHKQATETK